MVKFLDDYRGPLRFTKISFDFRRMSSHIVPEVTLGHGENTELEVKGYVWQASRRLEAKLCGRVKELSILDICIDRGIPWLELPDVAFLI